MNFVISICGKKSFGELETICREMELPLNIVMHGRGTAVQSMLDILGIEETEKRVIVSVCRNDKTAEFIREEKKRLFIGVPGHGIIISIPVKSIGSGRTVDFLNGGAAEEKYSPSINYAYELIAVIANEGRTELVMNAARAAGATGGTVLHGKGTGKESDEKFFNVSIAAEKEVILIVAKSEQKAAIMSSILKNAGIGTAANAIVFSLPVSEVAGFGMIDGANE